MTNTIIAEHGQGLTVTGGNTVTADSILWHATPVTVSKSPTATVTVLNQYVGDPAFASDGYHLTPGSAAVDQGIEASVVVDIDGEPRPAAAGYDLGADELWPKVYLPRLITNG